MRRMWKQLLFVPVLFVTVLAGCEAADRSPLDVTAPQPFLGGLLGGSGASGYTLVEDPLLPGILQAVSTNGVIGLNGGQLSLLGHTLTVPAGAVSQPTVFTLTVLPTGYVEVNLTATLTSVLGLVLNVGEQGFAKPVPITLSYARATNVTDPSELTVVHVGGLLGYRNIQAVTSQVDTTSQTVTAELEHFSRYSLAIP